MATRTATRVRRLSADDLGIGVEQAVVDHASNRPDDPGLDIDDPVLAEVADLLRTYGGVIFSGPPGTSKTWYAGEIGTHLVNSNLARIRFVQFHPSYQYEDFIQGFVPRSSGDGFVLRPRYFLEMCDRALRDPANLYVLVIDELSRGDPGRVFGEALTYIEKSKRGMPFTLASGDDCVIPPNFVILATMNPFDRGVDEVDAAFERRFAKIAMDPDRRILERMLDLNEVQDPLRHDVINLFDMMNGRARAGSPQGAVGHTFFMDVRDAASLRAVWRHQLRFLVDKAYRLDRQTYQEIEAAWTAAIQRALDAETRQEDETSLTPAFGDGGSDAAQAGS
jgi:5-methylcytosine-specific restriction enzyme B